jgi:uncharacterized caspase-like protein
LPFQFPKKPGPAALWALGGAALAAAAVALVLSRGPAPKYDQRLPPIVVTAKELRADFKADPLAARDKYRSRLVKVTGVILAATYDIPFSSATVRLISGARLQHVICRVPSGSDADDLAGRRSVSGVTLLCESDGLAAGGMPLLRECGIVHE